MNTKLKIFLTKLLVVIVLFLSIAITTKKDENIKLWINDKLLSKNFSFSYIRNIYNKYLGDILPYKINNDIEVFNEKLEYLELNELDNKIELTVTNNYAVPNLYKGVVTYVGEKDNIPTIIISSDEIEVWYININTNKKLYDTVEIGEFLGEVIDNKLYLTFKKDGEIVNYKEYL